MEQKQQLLLEQGAGRFWNWLRPYRWAFFGALVCGLLAHMFAFTNKLVNHDEVQCLFSKGATVDSGRWGLGALDSILPNFSMPWIYGIMTIVLIALAVCLMADLFSIRSKLLQVLLGGCVLSFPSLTGTFGYMFTSSAYGIAFLLAVLAVWLLCRKNWLGTVLGLGAMVLSLSIYQAYIAVAASLLVLVLIQRLLEEDKTALVFRQGVWFVGFLVVSLGVYYVGTQLVLKITGTSFNSYAGDSITFRLADIPKMIALAYAMFLEMFRNSSYGIIPAGNSRILHFVFLGICAVLLILWLVRKKRNVGGVLLLLVLLGVLPLAINCMYLFTSYYAVHTLVLYGFVGVYLLALILTDNVFSGAENVQIWQKMRYLSVNLMTLILAAIVVGNIFLANEAYLNLHLAYENTYAFYSTVLSTAQQMPGFDADTKIAVVGDQGTAVEQNNDFGEVWNLTGIRLRRNDYSLQRFVEYYMGVQIPFTTYAENEWIKQNPSFQQMPVYPANGSIAMIDGCLVVKLSQ